MTESSPTSTLSVSEIINESYVICEDVKLWMKDVQLVIAKEGLSNNTKAIICNEIKNKIPLIKDRIYSELEKIGEESGVEARRIMKIFLDDMYNMIEMISGYLDIFVVNFNLPQCTNEPDYKRELIYVLLGAVSMLNDNYYVYKVSHAKYIKK